MKFRILTSVVAGLLSSSVAAQYTFVAPPPAPISSRPAPPSQCKLEDYPLAALRSEATGETVLTYTLDSRGFLLTTRILRTAGPTREHKLLDAASVRSLWTCKFNSAPEDSGQTFKSSYNWKLEEIASPIPAASSPIGK